MILSIRIIVLVVATLFFSTAVWYTSKSNYMRAMWYFLTASVLFQSSLWLVVLFK